MSLLTPDMPALLLLTVLVFAAEHIIIKRLAVHYEWARLTKPQAYVAGVATFGAICLANALLTGCLLPWLRFALIVSAAGLTVRLLWALDPERPQEWAGMGSRRVTNAALALIENAMAFGAIGRDSAKETLAAFDMALEYLAVLRELPADVDKAASVQELRRVLALKLGKDKEGI